MPLGVNLATDIQAVFDSYPATPAIAATGFANAYNNYVAAAVFGPDFPVYTGLEVAAMAATLGASLAVPGLPVTHAAAWAAAVAAFWTAPPIVCAGVLPWVATACPGAPACAAPIAAAIAVPGLLSSVPAAAIAAALIVATATTFATLLTPPPAPFPIA